MRCVISIVVALGVATLAASADAVELLIPAALSASAAALPPQPSSVPPSPNSSTGASRAGTALGPPIAIGPPTHAGSDTAPAAVPDNDSGVAGASGPPVQIAPIFKTFENGALVTLDRPDGGAYCRAEGPVQLARDLRSVIFLDPAQAQDCFGPAQRRIDTYAGLDDGLDADTPEQCAVPRVVCDALAEPPRLRKHRSRAVFRSDGWIDVVVVTKGDSKLVPAPLRYTIVLHTDEAHLTVDLKAFKSMLSAAASP